MAAQPADREPASKVAASLPDDVREVCSTLAAAGYATVVVGGAVRDAVLGRVVADWDVATAAGPEMVQRMFRRTIATGIAHGTVTVLAGPGGRPVEVTTFRGEGVYLDGRRPSAVHFGVPLHEDLARRDLTINAVAFDPSTNTMVDPFGGLADMASGVIRAVGNPVARLTEDGLRVMRVVRFAATLDFAIDPATEAALTQALPSLAKVAGERIKVEMWKLLAARRVAPMLATMVERGIAAQVAPEWAGVDIQEIALALDGAPARGASIALEPCERLAVLVAEGVSSAAEARVAATEMAVRWRSSVHERQAIAALAYGLALAAEVSDPVRAAAWLAEIGREHIPAFGKVLVAWAAIHPDARVAAGLYDQVLAQRVALAVGELPIRGEELVRIAAKPPGPWLGALLRSLLAWTWEASAARTTHAALIAEASRRLRESGG